MNHIERFYATIERQAIDKPASWLGLPVPEAENGLAEYFSVNNMKELKAVIGDDIYPVEIPYNSPTGNAIYTAFNFAKKCKETQGERTLTTPGFFEDYSRPGSVSEFDWPDPSKHIDPHECKKVVEKVPEGYAILGMLWSCHFQDVCAAFGMETALANMILEPEMFRAVSNRVVEFYLQANEIFYSAVKGKMDAVLIGNDLGSQNGLMISRDAVKEFVIPGAKKLIRQAKSYGLKVIYHSCGAIYDIIPDLIDAGVDAIHPIQALAKGMDPYRLKMEFGNRVTFCGGVDAQNLLVFGTPGQVREKVLELKKIFPTGLIISPSHEAILPDVNPSNIKALFDAIAE